jgi:hypothetical protein
MTPPICFVMSFKHITKEELEFQCLTYAVYEHTDSARAEGDKTSVCDY